MLIPRVIPCLLVDQGGMVKTRKFRKKTYLGDPVNVINLFNRFEVDEIVLLDITASKLDRGPDLDVVENVAEECWVPLTYGGGITTLQQIEKLIRAGVEKVVLGTSAALNLEFVKEASKEFGSQCIVGSVDAKRKLFGGYECVYLGGKKVISGSPAERAHQLAEAGAGEILLQSINRDGEMTGYDLPLISSVTAATDVPVVACSGAGKREDLLLPILDCGASAAAAGSLFVFSGKERGVLINFPERSEVEMLLKPSLVRE
ncbi:imidazole glycerol phosphate synthase subunit HisF [Thalassospira tepidiphila]|jgi:imidazole glycerol-phosphate synthase subunit HisF|uniref:AglZ/HisF2 family acetamidino modification protein n=1 Tax=Thalassospira tepidiphila TaxID=393657 RepID=UPI001BCA78E8|nr:AglZ/HisF2 family acetamidino modification protein [Thalassospira tepidiphila]MBS8273455.1 imidazole glycerol phosphate synthase subunit HisF [Thalassospira tepidiphila]